MPKSLSVFDKQRRLTNCQELLHRYEEDLEEFEARIVTGDETWVYDYQPESKQQSKVWIKKGNPPPVKFKTTKSAGKTMITVFWDCKRVVLVDILPRGTTMTGKYYAGLLGRLREAVKKERRGILLQHDNASPHTSHVSSTAIHDCGFELLPHSPYSPDLAPSDYHLFSNLKKALGGKRFSDDNELKAFVNGWLHGKTQNF